MFFLMGAFNRIVSGIRLQGAKFKPDQVINFVYAGCMQDGTKESQEMLVHEILTQGTGDRDKEDKGADQFCHWFRDVTEASDARELGSPVGCEITKFSDMKHFDMARFMYEDSKQSTHAKLPKVEVTVAGDNVQTVFFETPIRCMATEKFYVMIPEDAYGVRMRVICTVWE